MNCGWRGVGRRELIVNSKEMYMGIGVKGALTISLSPAVGGGGEGVTLAVIGMKDLNKEVTRAMQDEFRNEKGKVDDEEAKITFFSLESDDQREKLLRLTKLQETQKKKKKKEERAQENGENGEEDRGKRLESRGKRAICVEDAERTCVCGSRREADKNAVGSDECAEEWAVAKPGGAEKRKEDEVEGLVDTQRGSRSNTKKGKERSKKRITSAVSEGERDENIRSEQRAWKKRCTIEAIFFAFVLKVGFFLNFVEFNGDGSDAEILCSKFGCAF
ncbi:uncharacterized protein MONOS_15267 [Monocercomonoides exilis]|uniref:uncharacterized protein n=1 Tax=Monocercomonoides exilis TaxID=2049356 RepID=UPI00355AA95C|nr:hypothetical protein MONOS_15267 [Monocercomonoides exilis]|eukprot:MONOS_15267.1-p1 / transcript=MONOS_15267.1 / gene=MONOS_15267 / organism=Monocercomonoides_exilis_PA203 / gene_product=unspecified product / transcript_product=unspecified product / location=Mono_scaffold01185:9220-10275(-) / protein_length=275 / sequence_SO=supercontig / SO=protein_coding / is_pseudo=false